MGVKSEISWRRRTAEGLRREIYVRRVGTQWQFFSRERRFEPWLPLDLPPLEDWLALLDAVRRRIARRLLRPEEADRLRKTIAERFPEVDI